MADRHKPRLSIFLPANPALLASLKALATQEGITLAELTKRALEAYLTTTRTDTQ